MPHDHPIRIFISGSSNDHNRIVGIKHELIKLGHTVIDPKVTPGDNYTKTLNDTFRDVDLAVFLMSGDSKRGLWAAYESGLAISRGISVLPIVIGDDFDSLYSSPILRDIQALRYSPNEKSSDIASDIAGWYKHFANPTDTPEAARETSTEEAIIAAEVLSNIQQLESQIYFEKRQKYLRQRLLLMTFITLGMILTASGVAVVFSVLSIDDNPEMRRDLVQIMSTVLSVMGPLLGIALGYYFGRSSGKTNDDYFQTDVDRRIREYRSLLAHSQDREQIDAR